MSGITKKQLSKSTLAKPEYDNGNSGASVTIDWAVSDAHKVVLNSANPILSFQNPVNGKEYVLKIVQDSVGGRIPIWPTNIKWQDGATLYPTQTKDAVDIVYLKYNGTDYDASYLKNSKKPQNWYGDASDGDLNTSGNVTLTSSVDGDVIVKQYNNLVINSGHTLTVSNRCKGLVLYVKGDCTIDGTIDMTGRGAYVDPIAAGVGSNGIRFARLKSGESDVLPASEVDGCGASLIATEENQSGIFGNGKIFQIVRSASSGCGGKGGDAKFIGLPPSGSGGQNGTCFGGGAGAGGAAYYGGPNAGTANGGPGGNGFTPTSTNGGGGGGAGNAGGSGGVASGGATSGSAGSTGTGGLIVLIVRGNLTIGASGVIRSNGANGGAGGAGAPGFTTGGTGGGGSGGGIIVILHGGTLSNSGTIQANGGSGGAGGYSPSASYNEAPGYSGDSGTIIGPTQIDQ